MHLLDIFFPKTCLECGSNGGYLCVKCLQKVSFADTNCPSCNRFSFYGKTHPPCLSFYSLDGVVSLWNHTGIIKKAISTIKYKFAYTIADDVATAAAIEVKKFKLSAESILIAVPLHRHRENWRGFNQSEEIARELAKKLNWEYVPSLLVRSRHTEAQVHLQKRKRLRNIRGKIAVNMTLFNKIDAKRPLVIVDDVWTTGSTVKECARVLKRAGSRTVWGLTIAKA